MERMQWSSWLGGVVGLCMWSVFPVFTPSESLLFAFLLLLTVASVVVLRVIERRQERGPSHIRDSKLRTQNLDISSPFFNLHHPPQCCRHACYDQNSPKVYAKVRLPS